MKQRPRIYYSESQKALMWNRWRRGDTIHQLARLFDQDHFDTADTVGDRRHPAAAEAPRAAGIDARGARGNLPLSGVWIIDSLDSGQPRARSFHYKPRVAAQRKAAQEPSYFEQSATVGPIKSTSLL